MTFSKDIALNQMRETPEMAPPQSIDRVAGQSALKRAFIPLATVCLTLGSVALMVPSALSQTVARSTPSAVTPDSVCAINPQGLMCNADQPELEASSTLSQAHTNVASLLQPSTKTQMEQLSDMLLGFLYFVLPIGFGLGLFLHDRYQSYRAAMLDAQIKLLEKLWEQSPQA